MAGERRPFFLAMIRVIREAKRTPAEIEQRLAQAGGVNRFGEPNFRAVWGWSRLGWIGGKWVDRDPATGGVVREVVEARWVPKYLPFDRWHIERWLPPEIYGSPENWNRITQETEGVQLVDALGPFPSRGEYEHCLTLEGLAGNFVPLDGSVCEWVVRAIEYSRGQPRSASLRAIRDREEKKGTDYEKWAYDVLDDAMPALHGCPFVVVPRARSGMKQARFGVPSQEKN